MKQFVRVVALSLIMTSFAACGGRQIHLVNPKDGMTIHGTFHSASDRIEVRLPSGELLKGRSVSLQDSIPPSYRDEGTSADDLPGVSKVYAILTDDKGTMMEALFHYNRWSGHGFGTAKTNKGEEYKIIF